MRDVINLLPEAIANQIAAGEVIQRPASVVKELLENAIDAGADDISLIVKNYGKSLIQVIDNGIGMTESDARMAFERHATSKIKTADDLFNIKTMGFRGEALPSIASIAEVAMKTRTTDAEVASLITIKSSEVVDQSYCQAEKGTSIAVKNLFFNVPARRKFLKTDSLELKYIVEEFKRVALANPEKKFRFIHNDNEMYKLPGGTLKKRIMGLFRKTYEEKLMRVEEDTDVLKISGLIGNPEIARKQKGEQYIFVNNRFIKSHYLNHAIKSAYDKLITEDHHPFYVLFLELDPATIDINVHPTKQEIKFDDERLVYNYLKVSVKHALGRYSLSPTLDFDNELGALRSAVNIMQSRKPSGGFSNTLASTTRSAPVMRNWQSLYSGMDEVSAKNDNEEEELTIPSAASGDILTSTLSLESDEKEPFQIHNRYILVQIKNGFFLINQNLAHQRILYERYIKNLNSSTELVQRQLFPISFHLSKDKIELFAELSVEIKRLGFDVQSFGGDTFVVHGIPVGFDDKNIQEVMDSLMEQYLNNMTLNLPKNDNLARSMALSSAIKKGQMLTNEEMRTIVDELFACKNPYTSPTGKKCFIKFDINELDNQFS
ncbi:MAG: DNA mismatch repair endonuclease MutL [Chitinophagia bacterium]|jgi:DNA mismatch repair protein MutL|nr:DNA mismatch repair endonuclease MutL [Chitinophagia bacterium]